MFHILAGIQLPESIADNGVADYAGAARLVQISDVRRVVDGIAVFASGFDAVKCLIRMLEQFIIGLSVNWRQRNADGAAYAK
ncbi:MAG: hypothetical protein U0N82_04215 [Oscillospiraceae bacterium]